MTNNQIEKADKTKLPAKVRAEMLSGQESVFFNVALFEHVQRVAEMFATSTMIPEQFQKNIGNCMIGLNYAARIKADPFMTMQTMYIVHGKPGVEGKLVAALINQSGKYSEPLRYQWLDAEDNEIKRHEVVNDSKRDGRGCRAITVDAKSGKDVIGPKVTWEIVHAEGWFGKNGSKWKTIPELMFMYRSASWFSNAHCPDVKLGMQTTEELHDVGPVELKKQPNGSFATESPKDIINELKGDPDSNDKDSDEQTEGGKYKIWPLFKNLKKNYTSEIWKAIKSGSIKEATEADIEEMKAKWERQVPDQPWPMDKPPGTEKDNPLGKSVSCPNRGGDAMFESYCKEKCPDKEGCPRWDD